MAKTYALSFAYLPQDTWVAGMCARVICQRVAETIAKMPKTADIQTIRLYHLPDGVTQGDLEERLPMWCPDAAIEVIVHDNWATLEVVLPTEDVEPSDSPVPKLVTKYIHAAMVGVVVGAVVAIAGSIILSLI